MVVQKIARALDTSGSYTSIVEIHNETYYNLTIGVRAGPIGGRVCVPG